MPIETATYVNDLTPANPLGSDPAGQGDDHLRLIKSVLLATFPNMGNILGLPRLINVAQTISATWNTDHLMVSTSATATVVLTTPAVASITTGFYVEMLTLGNVRLSVVPQADSFVNGGAGQSVPEASIARLVYEGSLQWRVTYQPNGLGTAVFDNGLSVRGGGVSVSGLMNVTGLLTSGGLKSDGPASISGNAAVTGALNVGQGLTVGGAATISGQTTLLSALNVNFGQVVFPASQNPNSGPNVLDDYEEGTFTPFFILVTTGNLSVVYSAQQGVYTKVGDLVHIGVRLTTTTWTWTTSSGAVTVGGLPFLVRAASSGALALGYVVGTSALANEQLCLGMSGLTSGVVNLNRVNFPAGTTQTLNISVLPSGTNIDLVFGGTFKTSS